MRYPLARTLYDIERTTDEFQKVGNALIMFSFRFEHVNCVGEVYDLGDVDGLR